MRTTVLTARTFDKLIATIPTRRSAGSLRSPFGATSARCSGLFRAVSDTVLQVSG
jgi:hypothetical protein